MMMEPHPWRDEDPYDPLARYRQTIESLVMMGVILSGSLIAMGFLIRSLAFFSLSIGFLEAACVNGILLAPRRQRRKLGFIVMPAYLLPIGSLAWMTILEAKHFSAPSGTLIACLAGGTTFFRFFGATILARWRPDTKSIFGPALRSSWRDLSAGCLVVVAGITTGETHSRLPDLVAAGIVLIAYLPAPLRTWTAARNTHWLSSKDWPE